MAITGFLFYMAVNKTDKNSINISPDKVQILNFWNPAKLSRVILTSNE
jgi:hypothetical protein